MDYDACDTSQIRRLISQTAEQAATAQSVLAQHRSLDHAVVDSRLCCRLFEFLEGLPCLAVKAVEFSSLVPAAKRAANLAAFKSGQAQVRVGFRPRSILGL